MNRPKLLALSALVAAAWCAAPYAQQSGAPSSTPPAASSEGQASSPSKTDRDTAARVDKSGAMVRDKSAKLERSERKFVEEVSQHNAAEIQTGKLADKQAANEQVKKFGERMAAEHAKADEEIKQLAQQKGIDLPGDMNRGHKRLVDRLEKLSGPEFDKRYMAEMVRDHEKDLKDFQKMAKDAKDPDIKAFAEKNARLVEEHLNQARQIADAAGARGGRRDKAAASVFTPADTSASTGANRSAEQRRRDAEPTTGR